MKKNELVRTLKLQAMQASSSRGQDALTRYFAWYFQQLEIPSDTKYDFWQIEPHIAPLLVDAIEVFRTSDNPEVVAFRESYELDVERSMPDLMDITGDSVEQALTVQCLGFLFEEAVGHHAIVNEIDQIFNAQRIRLMQHVYRFVSKVYKKGLAQFIQESEDRGMSGELGSTTIRTYYMAGRQLLTFARPPETDGDHELTVTLICSEDDPLALGIGIQSLYADVDTACAMLDDFTNGWPAELEEAWLLVAPDDKVGLA